MQMENYDTKHDKSDKRVCLQHSFTSFDSCLELRDLKEGSHSLIRHDPHTY